jgi:hypothetical protein
MKQIYELLNNFKIDKKYWFTNDLSGEDHTERRSKPAPYIKKTIEIAKKLNFKTVVEIGTNRYSIKKECVEYFLESEKKPFISPPCCNDGHSTLFLTECGFDVYTVDIDPDSPNHLINHYNDLGKEKPDNLHINSPKDGIEFLKEFEGKIDLLYLDGWDVGTPEYAEKHLEAFLAAREKLADVHLILIDDTDFNTLNGGKDNLLSPYLINEGYTLLFNGRQTLYINTTNVIENDLTYNFERNDFIVYHEEKNDETQSKVVITLSTVPYRLSETRDGWGLKPVIERLLNLTYRNYEIHLNIPHYNKKNNEEYIIPEWLFEYELHSERLKIFRTDDYGSITKLIPTLQRVTDLETTIITVDDDIVYEQDFIEYHLLKQKEYPNSALGFAGIGALDGSCHLCTTVENDKRVKILEGYKTVSYKRNFFKQDFFEFVIGKSWDDDMIISAYLGKERIPKVLMNYIHDTDFNAVVESYPVVLVVPNERGGCSWSRDEQESNNQDYYYNKGYLNE